MTDGEAETATTPRQTHGGTANLRPPSTSDEARELGRRGGIASGEARRRRASLREELAALLAVDDGAVAKSIVVAMCREAKNGNVGAFKAIAQVMGELKEVVEMPELPPPIVLDLHDAAFVAAERERQRREFAEIIDSAAIELKPGADGCPAAEPPETGIRAAGNAPRDADGKAPAGNSDAPEAPLSAPDADVPEEPFRIPRTPSEAARMRREREAREKTAAIEAARPARQHPANPLPATARRRSAYF